MSAETELVAADLPADPPEGYRQLPDISGFNVLLGPLFGRMDAGRLTLGFRVSPRHLNPHQTCHGGVLASFADMQCYAYQQESGLTETLLPTVNMTLDFLSPARAGEWVEGRASMLRASATLLFGHAVIVVGDRPVLRASSIYKISSKVAPVGSAVGDFFRTHEG